MVDVYTDTRQMSLFAEDMIQRETGRKIFVAGSAPEFSTMIKQIVPNMIAGIIAWNRARTIENELFELDERMLSDIGVVRGEIRSVARKWAVAESKKDRAARSVAKASSVSIFAKLGESIVDAYRAWDRRQQIENELYALNDHMLTDIGIRRNQISAIAREWVVAEARRDQVERVQVKEQKIAKVMAFAPAPVSADAPAQAANDDAHTMAA